MSKFALTEDENNSNNMPTFLVKKFVSTGFPREPLWKDLEQFFRLSQVMDVRLFQCCWVLTHNCYLVVIYPRAFGLYALYPVAITPAR